MGSYEWSHEVPVCSVVAFLYNWALPIEDCGQLPAYVINSHTHASGHLISPHCHALANGLLHNSLVRSTYRCASAAACSAPSVPAWWSRPSAPSATTPGATPTLPRASRVILGLRPGSSPWRRAWRSCSRDPAGRGRRRSPATGGEGAGAQVLVQLMSAFNVLTCVRAGGDHLFKAACLCDSPSVGL